MAVTLAGGHRSGLTPTAISGGESAIAAPTPVQLHNGDSAEQLRAPGHGGIPAVEHDVVDAHPVTLVVVHPHERVRRR
jgi:hypothetical protein